MNWEAMSAIGEATGAVAVVVTLFYVALQIRQNTRSIQASTLQAFVDDDLHRDQDRRDDGP